MPDAAPSWGRWGPTAPNPPARRCTLTWVNAVYSNRRPYLCLDVTCVGLLLILRRFAGAFNILAFGRKRWFLYPPSEFRSSTLPAAEWLAAGFPSPSASEGRASVPPLECVQEAGDVLMVPGDWTHATINIETSIGVATEFKHIMSHSQREHQRTLRPEI